MIFWFIIFIVDGIYGLPDGAPESACSTLLPRHPGKTAQTSEAPYAIHAELSGDKVVVHISSLHGEKFEGFMLQARSSKDPNKFIDGEFVVIQLTKAINCFNSNQNTLTHTNKNAKAEIMTEWTPREHLNKEIIFRATIAKNYNLYWAEVDSNPLLLTNVSASAVKKELYEGCFMEEGCVGLGLPDGCVERQDCEVLLRYSKSDDGINFILQGLLGSYTTNYMAVAWSEDDIMGEDSVRECIRDGTNVVARDSWNEGKSNTRTVELSRDQYTGAFVDGLTSCSWTSPLITTANGQTYDFTNRKFHVLLATGEVSEWRLKYHDKRIASPEALNLTEVNSPRDVSNPKVENSSPATGEEPPVTTRDEIGSTSQKDGSTTYVYETTTSTSCGSYLKSTCLMFLFTGVLFAAKESINYYIFKCLF